MARAFILFLKFAFIAGLYVVVLYHYAPADVVEGEWVQKPGFLLMFGRIVSIFIIYRLIKFIFFSTGQSFLKRSLSALIALPVYILITLFGILFFNGYQDDYTETADWSTNFVYFEDFKLACIAGALSDKQLYDRDNTIFIVLLPGRICSVLSEYEIDPTKRNPFKLQLSNGAYSISYVTAIEPRK